MLNAAMRAAQLVALLVSKRVCEGSLVQVLLKEQQTKKVVKLQVDLCWVDDNNDFSSLSVTSK